MQSSNRASTSATNRGPLYIIISPNFIDGQEAWEEVTARTHPNQGPRTIKKYRIWWVKFGDSDNLAKRWESYFTHNPSFNMSPININNLPNIDPNDRRPEASWVNHLGSQTTTKTLSRLLDWDIAAGPYHSSGSLGISPPIYEAKRHKRITGPGKMAEVSVFKRGNRDMLGNENGTEWHKLVDHDGMLRENLKRLVTAGPWENLAEFSDEAYRLIG